jgi:folate-binding protein YgfZ
MLAKRWDYAEGMSGLPEAMETAGAEWMPFGPPFADGTQIRVATDFGGYELEYAALRRYVGVMGLTQRGVIDISGEDRIDFLHRLVTQDIRAMQPGQASRALMLDAKGRVQADLIVTHGQSTTRLELDRFDIAATLEDLNGKLFAEDVTIADRSAELDLIALLGPASLSLWQEAAGTNAPERDRVWTSVEHGGAKLSVLRWDQCGVPGLRIEVPAEKSSGWWEHLLTCAGYEPQAEDPGLLDTPQAAALAERRRRGLRGRPVGWSAYNTARVESGEPVYHIDFGPDCLPAEAGLLEETVSFTKGCYTGQEAVARMKSLGHPKRLLVGLLVEGEVVPVAGTQLFEPDAESRPGREIGVITSSAPSPLRGGAPVAVAMVRWGRHAPQTPVLLAAEGQWVAGRVVYRESLLK